jgi:uncharacterized protein
MTPQDILDFADRYITALEGDDLEKVRAFYAPDARLWHNTDDIAQDMDISMKSMKWFMRNLPGRRYRVQRREALHDGFLQQHVLEATLPDGTPWSLKACVVIKMANGVITRLDEYMDSAETAALAGIRR